MDPVHSSVDHGRHRSTVDHGQGLGGGSPDDGQNGAPVCGTTPWLRKKGKGTAVILTNCKRGWRRDGNSRASVGNNRWRRRSVRAVLGHVTEIGRRGEGDEADGRGPHGRDLRERRRHCRNAQSRRKYTFWQIRQGCLG
jgi:hypothetical protein